MPQDDDKVQIGLTSTGGDALDQLMALGLFGAEGDAYKLGVAYALGKGMLVSEAPERGYGTKFHASGGLDRDGTLKEVVTTLLPEHADRPYATAERLAEVGVRELARRLAAHETLADILEELLAGTGEEQSAARS